MILAHSLMWHVLGPIRPLWWPETGQGYAIGSSWAGANAGLLTVAALYWRKHNCHVRGCWRLCWHTHPDHGHAVCRRHHPHDAPEGD